MITEVMFLFNVFYTNSGESGKFSRGLDLDAYYISAEVVLRLFCIHSKWTHNELCVCFAFTPNERKMNFAFEKNWTQTNAEFVLRSFQMNANWAQINAGGCFAFISNERKLSANKRRGVVSSGRYCTCSYCGFEM